MITTFENRCVLKTYLIVMIFILATMYKVGKYFEKTCEIYIINWSYSYKLGFFCYVQDNEIKGGVLG